MVHTLPRFLRMIRWQVLRRKITGEGAARAPIQGLELTAFWMQTTGACLFAVERCSPVRVWMAAQDSRSAHGLLYFAAVRDDRHHLIRRLCHVQPLPAHSAADLPKRYSVVCSGWQR